MTPEPACRPHVNAGNDLWHPPGHETQQQRAKRVRDARAICETCPLADACREAVSAYDYGIWGGMTVEDRLDDHAVCGDAAGTMRGVSRHRKARQPTCDRCRPVKQADDLQRWHAKRAVA